MKRSLYPAFLTTDKSTFNEELKLVVDYGSLPVIQVDIIDGEFINNMTLFPHELAEFDFQELELDIHLITQEPLDMVHEILDTEPNLPIRSIISQIERMSHQQEYIQEVANSGWQVGISLDLYTPLTSVELDTWSKLQIIQIMGNEAGAQGKPLHPYAIEKISETRKVISEMGLETELVVDVGVRLDNAQQLIAAGADSVCAGSALWTAPSFSAAADEFLRHLGYNEPRP